VTGQIATDGRSPGSPVPRGRHRDEMVYLT